MSGIDNSITLGVGEISLVETLGCYYQDISPALVHIQNNRFASLDENGIPYLITGTSKSYKIVLVIQYALMCFDQIKKDIAVEENTVIFKKCIDWLEKKSEIHHNAKVWRSEKDSQYQLDDGWISGMYQGQALSLYLRAYQYFKLEEYLHSAEKIFSSFSIPWEEGGFVRKDSSGCLWFEEYPGKQPSYVLNGFIYSILGILDFYRVTKNETAKTIWDDCVQTLTKNLHRYDVWYWSVYDQLKKQLVSYYYMKNVHIPLLKIMHQLTNLPIFLSYSKKWGKNLNNPFHRLIFKIMLRIKPRVKRLTVLWKK